MKSFSFYSLIIMLISAVLTWNAIAIPVNKIHLIENLSPEESHLAQQIIGQKGYKLSHHKLFDESKEAVLITKTIGNESEPASIQVEVVYQKGENSLPKRIYNLKLETKDVAEILKKLPAPDKLEETLNNSGDESIPVAFQN